VKKNNGTIGQARAQALLLLKIRPRSQQELKHRLTRKGFGAEVVEELLGEFGRRGLVDDAKFARFFATQKMMEKPMGRRAILSDLKAKGIDADLASQAAQDAAGGKDEFEIAREVGLERLAQMKGLPRATVERRLFGFLGRRGFSSEVIYRVLREEVRSPERLNS